MATQRVLYGVTLTVLATMPGSPASASSLKPAIPAVARPLPLSAVRLTGGPLKHAQDLNQKYLLELQPDRMLAYYRKRAGLEPKAEPYRGWDGDGKNLTGHIAGHYLSAICHMYLATGDVRFKERADYMVAELKLVQDKHGDGYLGALEGGREKFAEVSRGEIRSGGFDLNGLWAPWYVLHKTYAGLRDAYRLTGNQTALEVEIKFAAWAEGILSKLDEAQTQKMLNTEFGGMNEVLADLYADTSDIRWLTLSRRFEHNAVLDPLKRREDKLAGLHGNTQIPKLIGSLSRHIYTGDDKDGIAAKFFWDAVVSSHTWATGGHGKDEYFGPPKQLSARIDGRTSESCNVYNMLKMSRELFALEPNVKFADFQERALFNHVLGSIDPDNGRTCYMVPIGRGVHREYQDMFENFTCCVGSGMESHAMHGEGIYYEGTGAGNTPRLWVNLYTPSTLDWTAQKTKLELKTSFPEGDSASLHLDLQGDKTFELLLRRPFWVGPGFQVSVNGKAVKTTAQPDSYVSIKRKWKRDDKVEISLPKTLRHEPLADNENRSALMWGPLVLAADMGPEYGKSVSPVFVTDKAPTSQWLQPVPGLPGTFRSAGVGRDIVELGKTKDLEFIPFYRLHRRDYTAYWDLYTTPEWQAKSTEIANEQEKQRKLVAATMSFVQPGEMQPERDYNQQGEDTEPARVQGRPGRRARKWFSFDLPIDPQRPLALVATYNSEEWSPRTFDILVDGQKIGEQRVTRDLPSRFYDVEYPIPAELVAGKSKVTVRFQATNRNEVAAVFGVRIIRADAER